MGEKEFSKIKWVPASRNNPSPTAHIHSLLARFALLMPSTYQKPLPISEEDVLYVHQWQKDDYLGLDHVDRTGKARLERAV